MKEEASSSELAPASPDSRQLHSCRTATARSTRSFALGRATRCWLTVRLSERFVRRTWYWALRAGVSHQALGGRPWVRRCWRGADTRSAGPRRNGFDLELADQ